MADDVQLIFFLVWAFQWIKIVYSVLIFVLAISLANQIFFLHPWGWTWPLRASDVIFIKPTVFTDEIFSPENLLRASGYIPLLVQLIYMCKGAVHTDDKWLSSGPFSFSWWLSHGMPVMALMPFGSCLGVSKVLSLALVWQYFKALSEHKNGCGSGWGQNNNNNKNACTK